MKNLNYNVNSKLFFLHEAQVEEEKYPCVPNRLEAFFSPLHLLMYKDLNPKPDPFEDTRIQDGL